MRRISVWSDRNRGDWTRASRHCGGGSTRCAVVAIACLAVVIAAWSFGAGAALAQEAQVPVAAGAGGAAPKAAPGLSLADAIQQALAASVSVQLAELDVQLAEMDVTAARVEVEQGGSPKVLRQAEAALQTARDSLAAARQQVAISAQEQYYAVLRARELQAIQEQAYARMQRQENVAKAKWQAGLISRQDYQEVADQLADNQQRVQDARAATALEEWKLQQMLGGQTQASAKGGQQPKEAPRSQAQVQPAPLVLSGRFPYEAPGKPEELSVEKAVATALSQRSDVQQAARNVRAAQADLKAADNDYTPRQETEKARLALQKAQLQEISARQKAENEVRQAFLQLHQAAHKVAQTQRALVRAQSAEKIERARQESGMGSLLDVLAAEGALAQAQLDAAGAVWDYNLARAQFWQALGWVPTGTGAPATGEAGSSTGAAGAEGTADAAGAAGAESGGERH